MDPELCEEELNFLRERRPRVLEGVKTFLSGKKESQTADEDNTDEEFSGLAEEDVSRRILPIAQLI